VLKLRFFTSRFLLSSTEDLNSCEKYIETADTWLISLLNCNDVKIPLIDTDSMCHIIFLSETMTVPSHAACVDTTIYG
jgi:hypothetical protein